MSLAFIEPMLPLLVETPPTGQDWIHEVKYDGYRTQVINEDGSARVFTRNGHDWSDKFPHIATAAARLPIKSAIIDGEAVTLDEKGASSFHTLKTAIRWKSNLIVFVAFDLLYLDGKDLRKWPLIDRRDKLEALLGTATGTLQFSHHVQGSGAEFFAAVDKMGLEGIVSKRPGSIYRSGRSRDTWLKAKTFTEDDYEIAAVLREPGNPTIALMVTPDAERRYVGSAFITLNNAMRERLWARVQGKGPAPKGMTPKPAAEFVRPGMIGRVRHLKGEQKLRHATLREIRETDA